MKKEVFCMLLCFLLSFTAYGQMKEERGSDTAESDFSLSSEGKAEDRLKGR